MNYTNEHNRGAGNGIPSSRRNTSGRRLLLGFGDTMMLGDQGNPWIMTLRSAFRREPSDNRPATSEIQGLTVLNSFSAQQICPPTCGFFGTLVDPPSVVFGSAATESNLHQKYTSFAANANKLFGDHDVKLGWQFLRTKVDGLDSLTLANQIFATIDDYLTFGAVNSGIVPEVTEPCPAANPTCTPQNNRSAPFTSRNGNLVQQAGTFHNGPDLDKGPSTLALDHIFQINGLVDLPWQFQIGGIFRAQSGFHFSRFDEASRDPDGNGNFNGIDFTAGRNAFDAPPFVNLDLRFSKRFDLGERVKVQLLFEFFNVFNRQNASAIFNRVNRPAEPFGEASQVLPGREGQIGFRLEF